MRKVILYIAMSLDGFIADRHGGVDWLEGQNAEEETADTYAAFIQDVDTVVMGWNTYRQVAEELSPTEWVYAGLTSYVVTHRNPQPAEGIRFVDEDPRALLRRLRQEPGKAIWICGGASIVRQLMEADLIDEYYLSVIPTLLGGGTRLFPEAPRESKLRLIRTQSYNGITELVYTRR